MKKYTTLFLDLDNTILDFYKSENTAIKALLKNNGLPCDEDTARLYSKINLMYWERFEKGEIKREEIFENRFKTLLNKLEKTADTSIMSRDYFYLLADGHDVIDGAEEILIYLKQKGYYICITTNGISATQYKRINDSGLKKYFDLILVSEDTGHQKPEKEYFDFAFGKVPENDRSKILIIGDSQSSDILGGINADIDTCWLNISGKKAAYTPKYEIHNLKELKKIL